MSNVIYLTPGNYVQYGLITDPLPKVIAEGLAIVTGAVVNVTGKSFGTKSIQSLSGDMNLAANAGKTGDTAFLAGVMGNLFGDTLTKTGNYLGGVIGFYSVTGAGASTFPTGAVLAGIGDGSTDADGAVVAFIDGDSTQTKAGAAFKVMNNNSVPGSGFNYGVDLSAASHDGFPAVAYLKGEARLSNGQEIYTGSASTRDAVRAQAGSQGAVGSLYLSSAGKAYLKVANAGATADWERVTTTAAD